MRFILLINRQGKVRLQKWFVPGSAKEKNKIVRDVSNTIVNRNSKCCNISEYKDDKIVYKRYASLYFAACMEDYENELLLLEVIHRYVECLDRYFGNVCELDLIFNFEKAYHILDELIIGGHMQESGRKTLMKGIEATNELELHEEDPLNPVLKELFT